MRYSKKQILFQEVPNEISLGFFITWCPWNCKGCHSVEFKNKLLWKELTEQILYRELEKNEKYISTVLFFWWEWYIKELSTLLHIIETFWLKTALYSWLDNIDLIDRSIFSQLDYLKIGPYKKELWWLGSPITNQRFYDLKNWKDLTYLFHK